MFYNDDRDDDYFEECGNCGAECKPDHLEMGLCDLCYMSEHICQGCLADMGKDQRCKCVDAGLVEHKTLAECGLDL